MTFVVGSPAGVDPAGKPHVSVVGVIAPVAVVVEIVEADYVGSEVACGTGIVKAMIATFGPGIECVGIADLLHVGVERVGAAEVADLSTAQRVTLPVARGFTIAGAHADRRGVAIFTGFDAVVAGLEGREREIGRVDFEVIVVIQPANGDVDHAGGELDLNGVVIEVEEGESGHGRKPDNGGTELNFGARVYISPEFVAGGHGTVGNRSYPVVFASGLEGDGTFHIAEAGYATGRIVLIILRGS